MKNFEIYLTTGKAEKVDWDALYAAIHGASGKLTKFNIKMHVEKNLVRYFVRSEKDFSVLSSGLDSILLRPIDESEIPKTPSEQASESFVKFVPGGNLLDLKEKYEVSKQKVLFLAEFRIRIISSKKATVGVSLYFKDAAGVVTVSDKSALEFPSHLLSFTGGDTNNKYILRSIPKYLNIEKSLSLLSTDPINPMFSVDGFPYANELMYINLNNYEFDKHSFIVGASGSGKSKLISLFIDRLAKSQVAQNYRIIVVDPHAALAEDLGHVQNSSIINFNNQESAELFSETPHDIQAATELTTMLFKSIIGDGFNAHLERLLRYSLYVLFTSQSMSLPNLKRFLTEHAYRSGMVSHVKDYVPTNVAKFFGGDFTEMKTQQYDTAFSPIISIVDEMQMQPGMTNENGVSLQSTIENNFLTVFSLNKVSMGAKVVKTLAGLIIQQIFLLAQGRVFKEKVILIIDEVSVVQNPALAQILAEARKFNLHVVLTQQYFGQIDKNLQDAIFANVQNYYAFKVSEEDARSLEGNLSIELPESLVTTETAKGLKEPDIRVKIMTELNPRECLVRLAANGQILPVVKARTVDAEFLAHKPKQVDLKPVKKQDLPQKFDETKLAKEIKELPSANPGTEVLAAQQKPEAPTGAEEKRGDFNLSDILAKTSSSRFIINKNKDKK